MIGEKIDFPCRFLTSRTLDILILVRWKSEYLDFKK